MKCSKYCFLGAGTEANQVLDVKITDTKLYFPVVPVSTEDNIKLLKQLWSGFKTAINWNKYQSKKTNQTQSRYFNFWIDPSFQGVNRLFVLPYKDKDGRESY